MARSRRDINSLSPSELSDLMYAIDILRASSTADPDDMSGYGFQAVLPQRRVRRPVRTRQRLAVLGLVPPTGDGPAPGRVLAARPGLRP
ncbi:hypothetical protein GCM10010205_62000 [Streptomyces nojiriensis]|nr:hypothetical protein GCM10010205_62000 [Streptomyces nojiriensis]